MIYTLTLNPALDYDVYLDNFSEGDLNLSKEINIRAGGKGINVSKVLANLDLSSKALGFTGGFIGDFIKKDLETQNIDTDFVSLDGITRINVKINNNNKETEIAGLSPKIPDFKKDELVKKLMNLKDGDTLILSGSIPDSLTKDIYKEISKKVPENVKIVLDTRGNLLDENIHNNFLIKPNIKELEEMFEMDLDTTAKVIEKCKYFLDKNNSFEYLEEP